MRKQIYGGVVFGILLALSACGSQGNEPGSSAAQAAESTAASAAAKAADTQAAESKAADAKTADSKALEKTDISIGHLNSTAHLLAFVAKEEGFFEEEGLNAELLQFSSAGELVNGLESGKLDAAFIGSVPTITFQAQGHPIKVFGGAMSNGHGYVIKPEFTEGVSDVDVSILKGRTVASVKNAIQDAELQILLKNAGIEIGEGPDQVNIVYFDSQKDAYAALQNQGIDAASVYSPYASLAEQQGYKIVYRCSEEEALKNQPCCRQVATEEALEKYPNTYRAIERAFIKAYKFSQENTDQTIEDIKKHVNIEPELIKTEVYGGYGTSHPDPDEHAMDHLKGTLVDLGYTTDYDLAAAYDTTVYEDALGSLLEEAPEDEIYQQLSEKFERDNA